jgi:diaminopimelate decarboxylase
MTAGGARTGVERVDGSAVYPLGSRINEDGHLEVGGCDVVDLVGQFGTPAYIYAEDDVRLRARAYLEAFARHGHGFEVVFAAKAAPFVAALRLCREQGLSVDVASGGELHMALTAGFAPDRIHLHGNNKSEAELRQALAAGVGHVICDSFSEIALLDVLCAEVGVAQDVLIRVTPEIEPDTHAFIRTGQRDSKFGFGLAEGLAARAVDAVQAASSLRLAGLHAHLGSQILELGPYSRAIEALGVLTAGTGLECRLLNVGGGLGIAYTAEDSPPSIDEYVDATVTGIERHFDPVPRILVEPGRSLIGNAAVTAYRIGTVKDVPGVRTYAAVDGGMSDNLRPMLYGSRYDALIADRAGEPAATRVTVVGKHCESSDVLIRDALLAEPRAGDVLVTPATGAYGYAMANNYNAVPRPPVIFCGDGDARVVVRRETYEDLIARDE